MRDVKRIPIVLNAIQRYWEKHPDLRLAQIVSNMAFPSDPFYLEDDELVKKVTIQEAP